MSIKEVAQRSTFRDMAVTEEEIEGVISKDDPMGKMRFDAYNSPDGNRRVRAYNGHTAAGIIAPEKGIPLCLQIF